MKRLSQNLNSDYIEAMNRLRSQREPRTIVAYVESFDDVFFWSALLRPLETPQLRFEVMLPSRTNLQKGKRCAMSNELGPSMIACVDADYDYIQQGATEESRDMLSNPYVFHTYAYAIENLQCYAPALHSVCVMATLNDRRIFDFRAFIAQYSRIVWPLFCWNAWAYYYKRHKTFPMTDFFQVVTLNKLDFYHPENTLEKLRRRINQRINRLYHSFPEGRSTYKPFVRKLQTLGLTPETTYLYMRGHDLFDGIVGPLLQSVCDALRRDREREIRQLAVHETQQQNELASYRHSVTPAAEMLRRHTLFTSCPLVHRIHQDLRSRLNLPPS